MVMKWKLPIALYFMGQEALEIISLTKPGSDGNSTPPL